MEALLLSIEDGSTTFDNNLKQYMNYLVRWVKDAPRKRGYRQLRIDGMQVLSGEYFFDNEGGDVIIDELENTGKFAEYFIKTFKTPNEF